MKNISIVNFKNIFHKIFVLFMTIAFWANGILPLSAQTVYDLPVPGTMVRPSPGFTPALICGIKIDHQQPFRFDFIIDSADADLQGKELENESRKLIKYFLSSLTTPEKELWVNLSPYEKERIIPQDFGQTEMGRDLLGQDYILKQLTASLVYPEDELGKQFWEEVYAKAYAQYGTQEIPINTFNKVWIIPDQAIVYEQGEYAFVAQSHLKVLLEQDYLTLTKNLGVKEIGTNRLETGDVQQLSDLSSQIVREIVLPAIEKEVNEGKNFAPLRQIQNSLLLAIWYKKTLKESLLGHIYVDQNKIKGIELGDKQVKQKIYSKYLEAFKKGVYDYIKEDYDPVSREMIPRKYFSGGYTTFLPEGNLEERTKVIKDISEIPDEDTRNNFQHHMQEITQGGSKIYKVSVDFSRVNHEEYHQDGRFLNVMEARYRKQELAKGRAPFDIETEIKSAREAQRDLAVVPDYVSDDGISVYLDAFSTDHAGRNRRSVYARSPEKAAHELAELRLWEGYVVDQGIASREEVLAGLMGTRLRAWSNDLSVSVTERLKRQNSLIVHDNEIHREGLKAEGKPQEASAYAGPRLLQKPLDNFDITIKSSGVNASEEKIFSGQRNKKVHIIGATSFLGRKLYEVFKGQFREVVGTGFQKGQDLGFPQLDMTSEDSVRRYFQDVSEDDLVVYAAGWTDVDNALAERTKVDAVNADAVGLIAKYFQGKFVYISTDNVFDGNSIEPYTVTSKTEPANYYGRSKLQGEQITLSQFTRVAPLILRLGELYGFSGVEDRMTFGRRVINALEAGQSIKADSESWKGPILIDDVAEGLLKLLDGQAQGVHQMNGPEKLTKYLWAQKIAAVWSEATGGNPSQILPEKATYKEPRPKDSFMLNDLESRSVEEGTLEMLKQMGLAGDQRIPNDLVSIGISIGGTKIGVGLISGAGILTKRLEELKWREVYGQEATAGQIVRGVMQKIEEALEGLDDIHRVVKIGIAFAGPVDSQSGVVGTPFPTPNLPFDHYNLVKEIERQFAEFIKSKYGPDKQVPIQVQVYNDSHAAVLGEFNKSGTRGKDGMAFILGTGTNGAALSDGDLYTDHDSLLELGFNLIRKRDLGDVWIFTGPDTKGDRPVKQPGDQYNIDLFNGEGLAKGFTHLNGARVVAGHFVDFPAEIETVDQLFALIQNEDLDESLRDLRPRAIEALLIGITKAVNAGNEAARAYVVTMGRELGKSFAALVQHYYQERWVEHIDLVSSIGERFAVAESGDEEDDVFIQAIRAGLKDGLIPLKGTPGFAGLDEERIETIAKGIERSRMDWEREIVAAKLTLKDISRAVIVPKAIRDRYEMIRPLQGGGSSAGTFLVRDHSGREVVLKFANWAGIGSNGIPWLKAQAARLRELKQDLPAEGAERIPEVYDYFEGKGLVYYTLEYLHGGKPLSIYHLEKTDGDAESFLDDLDTLLTMMSKQFYSQGKLDVPDGYIDRVHLNRLNYRLGLLRKKEGDVYERLIKNRSFEFSNEGYRDISELFDQIWSSGFVSINGKKYPNVSTLLSSLETDSSFLQWLQPKFLPKFAHGDGLLRNFMKMPDGGIKVFDVRGVILPDNSPSRIDIPYELGKFLHGILLEVIRNDLFDLKLTRHGDDLDFVLEYDSNNQNVLNFLEVRRRMIELFKSHPDLIEVLKDEPDWLEKALFAEASHFLADAVNRLDKDLSGRHTIAYYLIGTMLMNEFLSDHAAVHSFEAGRADGDKALLRFSAQEQAIPVSPVGGINLSPEMYDLQIKKDVHGTPLPMRQQPDVIRNFRIDGLYPVILDIAPLRNLPVLTEEKHKVPQLSRND